jgi:hypothetical protein
VKTVTPAMRTSMAAKWTMNEGGQRLAGLSFSQFLLNKTYPLSKGSSFSTWKRHLAHSGPQGGGGPCHFLCGACPSGQVCKAGGVFSWYHTRPCGNLLCVLRTWIWGSVSLGGPPILWRKGWSTVSRGAIDFPPAQKGLRPPLLLIGF